MEFPKENTAFVDSVILAFGIGPENVEDIDKNIFIRRCRMIKVMASF